MRGRPKKTDSLSINTERENTALKFADMVIKDHKTIREIASENGVSKSTVHSYLKKYVDSKEIQDKIDKEMNKHWNMKHLKGGEATKKMYAERKAKKED